MDNNKIMVKHTLNILQCLKHNICESMFNHFFNFACEIDKFLK